MDNRIMDEMEDRARVENGLKGGPDEFTFIVDSYGARVMALAMNVLRNKEDAEDVCQESFVQAYRYRERFDPDKNFMTWIYTIAFRRCLDVLKKKRRFRAAFNRAKYEIPSLRPSPSSNPGREELLPSKLLEILSARERTALCLWANEDSSAREISEVLGCSESTARVYLFNARKKIKAHLEKRNAALQNG